MNQRLRYDDTGGITNDLDDEVDNDSSSSDDALEKEGLIMETSTNPPTNGIARNGISSDNLYIKFQKGALDSLEKDEHICLWAGA